MRVTVLAPATTANLGPGFDCLGAAVDLHLRVDAEWPVAGTTVEVDGEGANELPTDDTNLIVRAAAEVTGVLPPISLRVHNPIPLARGLGSSAAAIAAGLHVGEAITGHILGPRALLEAGLPLEGHPDNLAACLYGGLVLALPGPRVEVLARVPAVRMIVFAPDVRLATEAARRVLPQTVPHSDAIVSVARVAGLVSALSGVIEADPALLLECTADVLHQPYRAPLMPRTAGVVRRLRDEGFAAVVSGAGPSVLCLLGVGREAPPAPPGWRVAATEWDSRGARVTATE